LRRDLTGQTAIIESEGDDKRLFEGPFLGPFERIAQFGVKPAGPFESPAGEAGYKVVGDADGAVDGPGPVLAGEELFAIHPGVEPRFLKEFVECFDLGYVFDGIGEKDPFAAGGHEANVTLGIGSEGADGFDIDTEAFGEALPEHFDDVVSPGVSTSGLGGLVHFASSLMGLMVPRPGILIRFPRRSLAMKEVTN